MLFAALLVPWFVNWDSYKANFEREASRILGHPVHVGGAAHVAILPSPSVTFTDVEVGEPGALPMLAIETFSATVELVPLLQGEFRVTSMKLDTPTLRVSVDGDGGIDWLQRVASAKPLDPDRVVLGNVEVVDGSVTYTDAGTGVALAFGGIRATVDAGSLAGPWRVAGSYLDGARESAFTFATGRKLEDGTIRLQASFRPPGMPVDVSADGVVAATSASGLTYAGTYHLAEVAPAPPADGGKPPPPAGWRSEGTFALSRDRIAIDKAILSAGPADRPTSVAGSLSLNFGKDPSFAAAAEARQLDLDRTLGGGPDKPVNVASAAADFVAWIAALPVPSIPGRIALNVPGIVVGGSVVQDAGIAVSPSSGGWRIEDLHARLPGQATISASGMLTTARQVGFAGNAHLTVAQPSTFATWWRGGGQTGSGRLLAAFDISGDTTIAPGRLSVEQINARIGDAVITGRFDWGEVKGKRRDLSTDLKANRIDFAQVKALADLLVGRDLTDAAALADSFSIRLAADTFQYDDIAMRDVAIDAGYAGDVLNVVQLSVGDIGGASLHVAGGRIDDLTNNPRGQLDAHVEVNGFDGLNLLATKFLPDSGLAAWLGRTSASLTPAVFTARITAPPKGSDAGFQISVADGVVGETTVNASLQSAASLRTIADWRSAAAIATITLDSPDSAAVARQLSFAATSAGNDSGAHISVDLSGVPKNGMTAAISGTFAGLAADARGTLTLAADAPPAFAGTFDLKADDAAPFIATAGLSIPGAAEGTPIAASGSLSTSGSEGTLTWQGGSVAGNTVGGAVTLARSDAGWRIDGHLAVDEVDLGWLGSLSLGFPPALTGDAKTPWSKTPFSAPTYGALSGRLAVATQHLAIGDLDVTGGKLAVTMQPARIDADLKDGRLAGGAASGGISIQNVEGSANLTGQFALTGATLDAFSWREGDRPVATGALDLSANFEATGKSPAALVASMTGGGVIAIHSGAVQHLNPETANAIVRLSDLGEPFSDDVLRAAVAGQIDMRPLAFGETGGAFTIASGTVRLDGLTARGNGVVADGGAAIDLNALTLDSDWTVAFDVSDQAAGADGAKVGVGFQGPLAAPVRTIDALPFNSYLSTRQAARMLDVIAVEEADRAERQRLRLQLAKIQTDAAREEKIRQEAIAEAKRRAEVAARITVHLADAHDHREIAEQERLVASLTSAAENAAALAAAAAEKAAAIAARAAEAKAKADAAATALAASVTADANAAAALASAESVLAAAQAKFDVAAPEATRTAAAADDAEAKAMAAIDAEAKAKAIADKAAAAKAAVAAALDAANVRAASTKAAADAAASDAANASAALEAADKNLAETFRARDLAAGVASAAATAAQNAQTAADEAATRTVIAAQAAKAANTERTRLALLVDAATSDLRSAETARDNAKTTLDKAKADYTAALGDVAESDRDSTAADSVAAQAKRAMSDHTRQQLDIATTAYNDAEEKLAAASAAATAAQEQATAAATAATAAAGASQEAATASNAAQADLTDKIRARSDAARNAEATRIAAQRAGETFNAAQAKVATTGDAAGAAREAAEKAAKEQSAAALASAADSADAPAYAFHQATEARMAAVAAADDARAAADAARAAANAAKAELMVATNVHDAAVSAAEMAHATRVANQKAAEAAKAAVAQAVAAAAAAAEEAKARAADAQIAARRLQQLTLLEPLKTVQVPLPHTRQAPISLVPDAAFAGDGPMDLTPSP